MDSLNKHMFPLRCSHDSHPRQTKVARDSSLRRHLTYPNPQQSIERYRLLLGPEYLQSHGG